MAVVKVPWIVPQTLLEGLQRRTVQLLSFMYTESKITKNLNIDRPNMTLLSSTKIKFRKRFTRKTSVLNSPIYRGYQLWNGLPEEIQKIKSLSLFKNRIMDLFYRG